MGQLFLGFRSLLVKVAIFIVMAALLAWALGGTLWPRPHITEYPPVTIDGTSWRWQMRVGGSGSDQPQWTMRVQSRRGDTFTFPHNADPPKQFIEVAGPVATASGIVFAGRLSDDDPDSGWVLYVADENRTHAAHAMPDRLAVEQQIARLAAGLPVQDAKTIIRQRGHVIDPASDQP